MARLPTLCLVAAATTACGTLFNSKIKTIDMTSSPTQAEVWIDGNMRGMTPLSLETGQPDLPYGDLQKGRPLGCRLRTQFQHRSRMDHNSMS